MPNVNDVESAPRPLLPIIYVIDTSGSMQGERIAKVNEAMRDAIDAMKDASDKNPDCEIKIGIMTFSTGAEWITKDGLILLEDFYAWNNLQAAGLTSLGAALRELNDKLSRNTFLKSTTGYKNPVIIFMSDGEPNDNWEQELSKILAENKWYKHAIKFAFAIGDDADKDVLAKVCCGSKNEIVISPDSLDSMKALIVATSVTSSILGGQSRMSSNGLEGAEVVGAAKASLDENQDALTPKTTTKPQNTTQNQQNNSDDGFTTDDWS